MKKNKIKISIELDVEPHDSKRKLNVKAEKQLKRYIKNFLQYDLYDTLRDFQNHESGAWLKDCSTAAKIKVE